MAPTLPLPEMGRIELPRPGRFLQQAWSRRAFPTIDNVVTADVVHAPAYVLPATSAPLVATLHDLAFVHHPEWFTANGVKFLHRCLDAVRQRADAVMVPSPQTAQDCIDADIDASLIHIIPWGVEPGAPHDEAVAEAQQRLGVAPGGVVFVGTREPRKNLGSLAQAMKQHPDVPFTVIGPNGWGEVDIGRAQVTGRLSDADVAALVTGADLLVYPSHFEGFGLPVLEAMALGTPTIVTADTAAAWLADDAGTAVDTRSPDAIATAIGSLVGDPSRLEFLSEKGRERAALFSWSTTAQLTHDVYRSVAR